MGISEYNSWVSENARIHPDYVKEANEDLRKRGVQNAGFDEQGRAVAHSKKGRNDLLRYLGYVDKNAGYSDYAGS